MTSIGKKILSAFVEVADEPKQETPPAIIRESSPGPTPVSSADTEKFRQYFDKLFAEANIPGPDYYEFSCMTEAMRSIPDDKARYMAAFAGLSVQGLNKQQLLATAAQYLQVLDTDAGNFSATIDTA